MVDFGKKTYVFRSSKIFILLFGNLKIFKNYSYDTYAS